LNFREVGKNPRGAFEDRANFIFAASRIVLLSQAVNRTASNTVASKLSIPVLVKLLAVLFGIY
jgi:hypothetical protein